MPIPGVAVANRGSALLPVILLMLLFSGVALAIAVVVQIETTVSSRFRDQAEAFYAAEAGLAVAVAELRDLASWTPILAGARISRFSDGLFRGAHRLSGGGTVTLCCGARTVADRLERDTALSAVPARRTLPWQPFLWTAFDALVPQAQPSRLFLVVSIRDDDGDGDANAAVDANGVVVLRAEAIDANGMHRAIEAVVARADPPVRAVTILHWRDLR